MEATPTLSRRAFHCHTNWSDGRSARWKEWPRRPSGLAGSIWASATIRNRSTIANGLSIEPGPASNIRRSTRSTPNFSGIKIFKGTECDILADGALDFDDKVLATFDYVVASVHTLFNQTQEEMTRRIVRALSNPYVTMLGHATGRLLLRREGYKVDLEAVLKAAAEHGKMIEINAHPMRLDIDWVHCKRARTLGVKLVINPDAHSTGDLEYLPYGVSVARRGWLTKENVFNTKSLAAVRKDWGLK